MTLKATERRASNIQCPKAEVRRAFEGRHLKVEEPRGCKLVGLISLRHKGCRADAGVGPAVLGFRPSDFKSDIGIGRNLQEWRTTCQTWHSGILASSLGITYQIHVTLEAPAGSIIGGWALWEATRLRDWMKRVALVGARRG